MWASTVTELSEAIDAHNDLHAGPEKPEAPSKDEMAALLEKYG